jgi:hypothetical protein
MFTKVYETLRERGFTRAGVLLSDEMGEYFSCRYRSPRGPCAIGIFLPDEAYDARFEGTPASYVAEFCPELKPLTLTAYDRKFLFQLQVAHDDGISPELMKDYLERFAAKYELEVPK